MHKDNKIDLIKFKKEDAKFIIENFPKYFQDNSIKNIERIIDGWESSLGFCVTFNKEKVGLITLSEKNDKKLSWGIMIKEEFRGKGIAKQAFKMLADIAKGKGYSTIISSCSSNNIASKKLHENVGFSLIKKEINNAGQEMCRWELNI